MLTLFPEKEKVVKLAFRYIDKVHINPSEAPKSVKSELAKKIRDRMILSDSSVTMRKNN